MSCHHFDSSHAKKLQTEKFQELNCDRSLGSILEFIISDSYFITIYACIDMDISISIHIHTHHHYLFIPVSMSRKLIVFIVGAGLLLLFLGSTLVFLYSRFRQSYKKKSSTWKITEQLSYRIEKKYMEPFIVIGPVLIGGGVMTVFFSVEVKKSDTSNFFSS